MSNEECGKAVAARNLLSNMKNPMTENMVQEAENS